MKLIIYAYKFQNSLSDEDWLHPLLCFWFKISLMYAHDGSKMNLVTDAAGKFFPIQDVLICLTQRKFFSLREFYRDLKSSKIQVQGSRFVIMVGIGYISMWDKVQVQKEFTIIIDGILNCFPKAEIYKCSILFHVRNECEAISFLAEFNQNLQDVVHRHV